jgi:hypothetical protein
VLVALKVTMSAIQGDEAADSAIDDSELNEGVMK